MLKDGYLSWYDPASRKWWQRTWFGGAKPTDKALEKFNVGNGNLRQAIDRLTEQRRAKALRRGAKPSRTAVYVNSEVRGGFCQPCGGPSSDDRRGDDEDQLIERQAGRNWINYREGDFRRW